jgi:hypothetical protein
MGGGQAGRGFSLDHKTHCHERNKELAEEFILEHILTENSCTDEVDQ